MADCCRSSRSTPPFQFQACLDKLALAAGEAEADAGGLSLRRTGYYVGIARARRSAPARASLGALTAVVVEDEPTLAKFIQSYLAFEASRSGSQTTARK